MTLFGPDGSIYQRGIKVSPADWDATAFVIWRCVHEDGTPDPTYIWARDACRVRGVPFMAYAFLPADPRRQPAAIDAAVADDVPVMCDWERSGCTADEMFAWVGAVRARGNTVPLLYTGRGFWIEAGKPTLAGHGFDLVVARYGNQSPTGQYEAQPRYESMLQLYGATWDWNLGGLTPKFWQFGSRIRWGDRYMDMNAFEGDRSDLARWFWMPTVAGDSFGLQRPSTPAPRPAPAPVPAPAPLPTFPKGDDMLAGIFDCSYNDGIGIKFEVFTGGKKLWIMDEGMLNGARTLCRLNGLPDSVQTIADPGLFAAMGRVEGLNDPVCDEYGVKVR